MELGPTEPVRACAKLWVTNNGTSPVNSAAQCLSPRDDSVAPGSEQGGWEVDEADGNDLIWWRDR